MLTLFLLIFCVVLLFKLYITKNKNYWKKRNVFQVDGVVSKFMSEKRSLGEIYKDICDQNPSYPHFGIFLGSSPTLLLKDLQDIQSVLQSNFYSFHNRGIVTNPKEILANNILFVNDYNKWKLLKQSFSPALKDIKLKNTTENINKVIHDYINNIKYKGYVGLQELYPLSTAVMETSIFGLDKHSEYTNFLTDMYWKINDTSNRNNIYFYISNTFPTIFKLFNLKHFNGYNNTFVNIFKKNKEIRRKEKSVKNDILDTVLQLQENNVIGDSSTACEVVPSDELLAAQYFLFCLGGIDNISIFLHFAMLELSNNKNILTRIHNEIDTIIGDQNNKLTFDDLEKLQYSDMIVSEVFRKYPPVFAIQRCCTKDTVLPSTKEKVSKGTVIIVPVFALHRDPNNFPDPEKFDPERFSKENQSKIKNFSYIPFGEGRRRCLGIRFGRQLCKFCLVSILRKLTLKEQIYETKTFDPSFFSLRDSIARFEFIPRN